VELHPGDVIMTGTPAGVGRVVPGDVLEGHVDGVGELRVEYETECACGRVACRFPTLEVDISLLIYSLTVCGRPPKMAPD
jgi:hypothetical protein